jgi:hypothetical protein
LHILGRKDFFNFLLAEHQVRSDDPECSWIERESLLKSICIPRQKELQSWMDKAKRNCTIRVSTENCPSHQSRCPILFYFSEKTSQELPKVPSDTSGCEYESSALQRIPRVAWQLAAYLLKVMEVLECTNRTRPSLDINRYQGCPSTGPSVVCSRIILFSK